MSARDGYRIADEPRPGPLDAWVVAPHWPLLSLMLAGPWLAWPWALFNSWAMGSPTKWKEHGLVLLALALPWPIAIGTWEALGPLGLSTDFRRALVLIPVIVVKLLVGYFLHSLQSGPFELREHFGGESKNGMMLVLAGFFLGPRLGIGSIPGLGLVLQ
ncbi:MAG: hypothetical protein AAF533_21795 [Acidobacteriota bacterium]